jgi:hypothetical protein
MQHDRPYAGIAQQDFQTVPRCRVPFYYSLYVFAHSSKKHVSPPRAVHIRAVPLPQADGLFHGYVFRQAGAKKLRAARAGAGQASRLGGRLFRSLIGRKAKGRLLPALKLYPISIAIANLS